MCRIGLTGGSVCVRPNRGNREQRQRENRDERRDRYRSPVLQLMSAEEDDAGSMSGRTARHQELLNRLGRPSRDSF